MGWCVETVQTTVSQRFYKPTFSVSRPISWLILKTKRSLPVVSLSGSREVQGGLNGYV